jgi:hypothetical protein
MYTYIFNEINKRSICAYFSEYIVLLYIYDYLLRPCMCTGYFDPQKCIYLGIIVFRAAHILMRS